MNPFPHPATNNRIYGITIGIVTSNQDPEGLGRVKVRLPWLADDYESDWARVLSPMAGPQRGLYFIPEPDDEVLVAFEHGIIEFPYVLGALWNNKDKPPEPKGDGKNNLRTIKSRSGHVIRLDDSDNDAKIVIQDASGKNRIVLSTKDNAITIVSDADINIQANNGKLKLSGQGVEIDSSAQIKIEAKQNMDLQAGPQLNIKGKVININ